MNPERFIALYERIAEAPDAVARLRRFILELAVRGKLVEQDHSDEPAGASLKRLADARALQRSEQDLRRRKSSPDRGLPPPSFAVPTGWEWARLADLVNVINGRAYAQSELLNTGTPVLRVGNLFTSDHWYYSNLELEPEKYCDAGDLIFAWSASFGPFIWGGPKVIYHYHIWKLALHSEQDLEKAYLYRFLLRETQQIKDAGHGISMVHMTKQKMERVWVPVPPLAEQRRIVARVDQLMALCERLDQAQHVRDTKRDALAIATLQRVDASDSETSDRRDHVHFALSVLPTILGGPDQIAGLRQTILTAAVQGRLVEQSDDDEPVARSLAKSDAVRAAIAEDDRRANADAEQLLAADQRWTTPSSWSWRALADLVLFIDYRGRTPTKVDTGVTLITAKNVKKGVINAAPQEFISEESYDEWMTRGLPAPGDVLFTTEAPMGNAAVVLSAERFALAQRVICFRGYGAMAPRFLVLQLLSRPFQSILERAATGLTAKGIKAAKLKRLPIAIPPLAEQERIVSKVEELSGMCERLEAQLRRIRAERGHLLDAMLHEVLFYCSRDAPMAIESRDIASTAGDR